MKRPGSVGAGSRPDSSLCWIVVGRRESDDSPYCLFPAVSWFLADSVRGLCEYHNESWAPEVTRLTRAEADVYEVMEL